MAHLFLFYILFCKIFILNIKFIAILCNLMHYFIYFIPFIVQNSFTAIQKNGGWETNENDIVQQNEICNIERHDSRDLTQEEFIARYAYSEPVIIYNIDNTIFQKSTEKEQMMKEWANINVTLNSANTYSYRRLPTTFGNYIEKVMKPQTLDKLGNETFYLFGDIDPNTWKPLLELYKQPSYGLPEHTSALSFGIAGPGTGVPFHFHGPGFAEVIHGSKRWFLYAPNDRPEWNPDKTTLEWYLQKYPNLERHQMPLECEMKPGEIIYFPDKWWHATLNIQSSVFISTFLSP